MLGNMHHLKNDDSPTWILTDIGNKVRYIEIIKFYKHLGPSLSNCLPGFHAIIRLEDTNDADDDNEDIQYQHWIDDDIPNFNNDNEDIQYQHWIDDDIPNFNNDNED
ncbi:hypothetical protein TNCT_271271 [Trichonephila clavata]|uniref:Uncharacterized protein n=1 Tax=Trichonephila clavata TaxID=2740835 RepID=A0A8X6KIW8_TRICU|nr:hypothetical protein TNCT_271271 [Trichonephila clavata]